MLQKGRYTELMSYIHRLVSENRRDPQWRLRRLEAVESILLMGLWETVEKLIEKVENEKGSHRLAFVQDDNARVVSAVGGGGGGRRASGRTGIAGGSGRGGEGLVQYGHIYGVGDRNGRGRWNRGAGTR